MPVSDRVEREKKDCHVDKQTVKEDKGDCTERDRGLKWREKNRLAYGQTDSKRRQGRLQREREGGFIHCCSEC